MRTLKKTLSVLLVLAMLTSMFSVAGVAAEPGAGGEGTDPSAPVGSPAPGETPDPEPEPEPEPEPIPLPKDSFNVSKEDLDELKNDTKAVYQFPYGKEWDPQVSLTSGGALVKDTDYSVEFTYDVQPSGTFPSAGTYVTATFHYLGTEKDVEDLAVTYLVKKAAATVTAADKKITYGDALPTEWSYTVTGDFKSYEEMKAFCKAATAKADCGETPDNGTYAINFYGADDEAISKDETDNYVITYVSGELTVSMPSAESFGPSVKIDDWIYGDAANEPAAQLTNPGQYGAPEFTYYKGLTELESKPVDAGVYSVKAVWAAPNANLPQLAAACVFFIHKRPVTLTAETTVAYTNSPVNAQLSVDDVKAVNLAAGDNLVFIEAASGEDVKDVGTYTITEYNKDTLMISKGGDAIANGNYEVSFSWKLNVTKAVDSAYTPSVSLAGWTYGDAASAPVAEIAGPGAEGYAMPTFHYYHRDAAGGKSGEELGAQPTDAGAYVVEAEWAAVEPNLGVQRATASFDIAKRHVTISADNKSKPFGTKDAPLTVSFVGLANEADKSLFDLALQREKGEAPDEYTISFAKSDASKAANYVVDKFNDGTYTITGEIVWDVKLGETDQTGALKPVTSHDSSVSYAIVLKDGENYELLDDIREYVTIVVDAAAPDWSKESIHFDPLGQFTISGGLRGAVNFPSVSYFDGEAAVERGHEWTSYLPVGTVLKLNVKIDDSAAVSSGAVTITPVPAALRLSFDAGKMVNGTEMRTYEAGGRHVLSEVGEISVHDAAGENAVSYIDEDDWIVLTIGSEKYYIQAYQLGDDFLQRVHSLSGEIRHFPMGGVIDYEAMLLTASADARWRGTNPTGSVTVQAELLDALNHEPARAAEAEVAFDTGAENSVQTVGNRADPEGVLALEIADTLGAGQPVVVGSFGGSMPSVTSDGALVWRNVSDWKNTPDKLPHSGESFKVQYTDGVGHTVTHTVEVVKSDAVTANTLFVKPMTDETVPSGTLVFYGETNAWEKLELTVNGRAFSIDPIPSGETYDNSSKQWTYTLDLSEIGFPSGEKQVISLAYEDLEGKASSIQLTYDDAAQTPVLASEAVEGLTTIWGYVEEGGSSVLIDIQHADGAITPVPGANVAVDQFGYFYARLDDALAEGDVISITTEDFCGNKTVALFPVVKELEPDAFAELLGANIIDEIEDENETDAEAEAEKEVMHRFATPIDLAKLAAAENKSMELPLIAYKGIEIGSVNITLTEEGQLEMTYSISATDFIPEGAQARLAQYAEKPELEQLIKDAYPVVVEDLQAAPEGSLPAIDVTGYATEEGTYEGVLWLSAQFDVELDADSYISRGGRGVNFYRWLTESEQTEDVLNAVYKETVAYESNVELYELYQGFEDFSKKA